MNKKIIPMIALLATGMALLTDCAPAQEDPGPPPAEVVNPGSSAASSSAFAADSSTDTAGDNVISYEGTLMENAASVRIGRDSQDEWAVDMYNNAAANTMLGYLSGSALLFPTYTYEETEGYVAQHIRGSYTREDEAEVADIHAGELYLFSDGQLRFYWKDAEGAQITATLVGRFAQTEGLAEAVQSAYESNLGDTWNVSVYFWITKTASQ